VKYLSGAPLYGRLEALPTYIRHGWKGLPGTYSLVYYKKIVNYSRKKFYDIDTWKAPATNLAKRIISIETDIKS
jgi:hypothetical protein